jgi:hypothetical protein
VQTIIFRSRCKKGTLTLSCPGFLLPLLPYWSRRRAARRGAIVQPSCQLSKSWLITSKRNSLKGTSGPPAQKRRISRSRGEGNSPAPRPINRAAAGAFAYRHREAERGTDCPRRGAPDACVKDRDPQGRDLKTRRAPRVEPDRHGRGDTIRRNRARYRCQSSPSRARSSLQKRQHIPSPCAGCKQRVRHQGPCRRPTRGPISLRRIVLHAANLASCEPSKEQAGAPDLIGRRLIV